MKTITCPFGEIEVISDTAFKVSEFAAFGCYFIPDTQDISSIEAVLSKPDWTEDQLNNAVETLNEEEERREHWGKYLKERHMQRHLEFDVL